RLSPTSGASSLRTCARRTGDPPRMSSVWTAKTDVSRAPSQARPAARSSASPITTDLPEGARRTTSGTLRPASIAAARAVVVLRAATRLTSPRLDLPLQRSRGEGAEELHLVLQREPELLVPPPPRLVHEGDAVGRGRVARVLDEVRVSGRHERTADPVS